MIKLVNYTENKIFDLAAIFSQGKERAANFEVITHVASKAVCTSLDKSSTSQNLITSSESSETLNKQMNTPAPKMVSQSHICNNIYKRIFLPYIAPILSLELIYNNLLSPLRYNIYNRAFVIKFVQDAMNCPVLNAVKTPFQIIAFLSYEIFDFDFDILMCVIVPITEEILIRNLLQEQFLKIIPEKILGKINKDYAEKFNKSLVIRISRVLITSLIFANYHDSSKSYVWVDCFFFGLLFGGLQEVTGSTLPSAIAHIAHNTLEIYKIVSPLGNY